MLLRKLVRHTLSDPPDYEFKSPTYSTKCSKDADERNFGNFDSVRLNFDTSEDSHFVWKYKALTKVFMHLQLKLKRHIRQSNPAQSTSIPSSSKFAERLNIQSIATKLSFSLNGFAKFCKGERSPDDFNNIFTNDESNTLHGLGSFGKSIKPYKLEVILPDTTFWDDFKDIIEKYGIKTPLEEATNALISCENDVQTALDCQESNFQISKCFHAIYENDTFTTRLTGKDLSVNENSGTTHTRSTTVVVEPQNSPCSATLEAAEEVVEEIPNPLQNELLLPESDPTTDLIELVARLETEYISPPEENIVQQVAQSKESSSSESESKAKEPEEEEEEEEEEDISQSQESSHDDGSKEGLDFSGKNRCHGTVVGRELSIKYNTGRLFCDQEDYVDASTGVEFRFNRWGDPEELVPYGYQRTCHHFRRRRSLKLAIRNLERRPLTVIQYSNMLANVELLHRANLIAYRREATILLDCVSSLEEDRPFTFIMNP